MNSRHHTQSSIIAYAGCAALRSVSGRPGHERHPDSTLALRTMRRSLIAALVLAGAMVLPSSALALNLTWSGLMPATAVGSGGANWSKPGNWVNWPGTSAAMSGSTLSFPVLTASACTAHPPTSACYASTNDVSGVSAAGMSLDDGVPYQITGNAITLGGGGITARPSPSDAGQGSPSLRVPISLAASQTWSITGGPDNQQFELAAPVTGATDKLAIGLSNQTVLGLYADDEVGPVSVTSSGAPSTVQLGFPGNPGSLNWTDGKSVSFSGGAGLSADSGTVGPLSMTGGQIQVGGAYQAGTLAVNGAVSLDSASSLSTYASRSGTRAGTDFSQLSATGTVSLGNAQLSIGGQTFVGETPSCPVLTPGDVDTLVTTTGSLAGTFAGVPDGTTIPIDCTGGTRTPPTVRINYTAHTVTATVATSDGVATATTLAPPASAVTNESITLTAKVSAASSSSVFAESGMSVLAGSGTPNGTVEFDGNGTAIAGCSSRPLALDGTATCRTAFTAASHTALAAVFEPADGSSFQDSTSAPVKLAVGADSTATTLTVSSSTPAAGAGVTYTATVTPADAGAAEPSGSVEFLDGGTPVGACARQPLTAGLSSSVAICTLSYPGAGPHGITAAYLGDGSFAGSTSSPTQTVTVQVREAASNTDGTGVTAASGATAAVGSSAPASSAVTLAHVNCKLTPRSKHVLLRRGRRKPGKQPDAKQGMMAVVASCDQAANVTLKGYVTEGLGKGPKRDTERRRVFKLTIERSPLTARAAKVLWMKLPAKALLALQHGSKESATFTLIATNANGTTRVTTKIAALNA